MKRPLIYFAIVLILAAVVIIIERPDIPSRGDVDETSLFPGYDAKDITRIEVGQILSGVQAKREGDAWQVADFVTPMRRELMQKEGASPPAEAWYPADRAIVEGMLGIFGDFPRGMVVSANPEKQAEYQVTGPLGLSVRLYKGDAKVVDVVIGRQSPDYSGNIVKVGDSNDLTLSDRILTGLIPVAVAEWRERTIWRVAPERLRRITITRPKDSLDAIKGEDGVWRMTKPSGEAIDQAVLKGLAEKYAQMRAAGFANAGDPMTNFKNAIFTVRIELDDGTVHELAIGGANNLNQYYARHTGDTQVYLVENPEFVMNASRNKP